MDSLPRLARRRGAIWPAPSFFQTRGLMCAALCLFIGILFSRAVPYGLWMWAVVSGLFLSAALLRRWRRVALPLLLLGFAALGLLRGAGEWNVPAMPELGRWTVAGTVEGQPSKTEKGVAFFLRDMQVMPYGEQAWTDIDSGLYVFYPTDSGTTLSHGQRVTVAGTAYAPTSARNPGGFDQRSWLAQSGTHVRLYASGAPRIIKAAGFSLRGWAISVNEALGERMDALFGAVSPVVRAMLLGDETEIPGEWKGWMRDSGIAHLLSVSGLHVGLWYVLLELLLRPVPVSPRVRWALLAFLLCAYALVTGLKVSALRAVIMLLCVQGGRVARRKVDPLTSLSLAALVLLLLRPLDLFAPGFQLSFFAVLGLTLLGPVLRRRLCFLPDGVSGTLSATLAAQAGFLPAASWWFGSVSLGGIALNLLAVPLSGLMIPVAAAGTALDAVWPPLGRFFVESAKGMAQLTLLGARLVASIPHSVQRVGAFTAWQSLVYYTCLFLCSSAVVWRWRARAAAMGLAVCVALGIGYAQGAYLPRYVQLDVGQALSGVLHVSGQSFVYDTGSANSDLTEYLLYTGTDVDGLFLSHPHEDHIGGTLELLDEGIAVRTVYVPANADAFGAESGYEALLSRLEKQGGRIVELSAGDTVPLNGATATVIAPEGEVTRGNDPNDRSLVLLIEVGGHSLLLCGDADGAAEPLGVDCDVVQVAHHGSALAAREAFLRDATPDIALISVGRNSYGHPNAQTLARLTDAGARIYLTQETGAITLYFSRDDIRVEAYVK